MHGRTSSLRCARSSEPCDYDDGVVRVRFSADHEVDDLQGDIATLNNEVSELESDSVNREEFAEKCFKAGNPELWIGKSEMQAWLNFRMEIRL